MTRRWMPTLPWISSIALGTMFSLGCPGSSTPSGPATTTANTPANTTGSVSPPVESVPTTGDPSSDPTTGSMTDGVDESGESTGSGVKLDVGGGQKGDEVQVTGRVVAPNGEIPISGALVWLTSQPPPGIPDGVYCDECETLDPGEYSTVTQPDGTFEVLAAESILDETAYLVVNKGQFLRVSEVQLQKGGQAVAESVTQLPGIHNPAAGRWIPRIGVYDTWPDEVFNVLAKFGLGDVSPGGTLIPGTERFTLLPSEDQGALLDDLPQMSQYHIIFIPCATSVFWAQAPFVSPERIQNIRDYVAAGGRWYATDHSNEYIKEPFPLYLDLHSPAMPDIQPAYTVTGTVVDPNLLAWLSALPPELADIGGGNPTLDSLPSVELMDNYSGIDAVHPVVVQDEMGQDVDVGPHTWVEGSCTSCANPAVVRPMAVSGQYGCGRMMYSTFETSSSPHQGLNPQELVLLYMILEIGGCQDDLMPPPQG